MAGALVLTGTLFYWRFEDWTIIESFYFCIVTLTTVGFGDLSPTTAGTQIFTVVYILTGFGVLVALLTSVAQHYLEHKTEDDARAHARRARRRGELAAKTCRVAISCQRGDAARRSAAEHRRQSCVAVDRRIG